MSNDAGAAADFQVEHVPIDDLRPHPRNYRHHPEDQLEHLAQSIKESGVYRNIVVARDNTILAGHGVVLALRKLKYEIVPVYRVDVEPDAPLAIKVLTGDNEIEHLAVQDDRALSELLKELADSDELSLLGTGYDDSMLANLAYVTRDRSEIKDFDEARHWVGMPEYDEKAPDAPVKMVISFRTEEDRLQFAKEKLGAEKAFNTQVGTWTTWWPPKEREDLRTIRFEVDENGEADA